MLNNILLFNQTITTQFTNFSTRAENFFAQGTTIPLISKIRQVAGTIFKPLKSYQLHQSNQRNIKPIAMIGVAFGIIFLFITIITNHKRKTKMNSMTPQNSSNDLNALRN